MEFYILPKTSNGKGTQTPKTKDGNNYSAAQTESKEGSSLPAYDQRTKRRGQTEFESQHDKTNKVICAPSEDSDEGLDGDRGGGGGGVWNSLISKNLIKPIILFL